MDLALVEDYITWKKMLKFHAIAQVVDEDFWEGFGYDLASLEDFPENISVHFFFEIQWEFV
jgi:hypothetical protein